MKKNSLLYCLVALLMGLVSCTSSRPSYVLSSGEMEDLLYDMHKAHYLQENMNHERFEGDMQYAIMLNVLKQHDVTQAEWDSSMVYYTRNADEMEDIYVKLMDRLEYESTAMGAGTNRDADSTNIWSGDKHVILTYSDLSCTYQWKQEADTLLKPGEKLKLRFEAVFLNPTAQRRASAVIALRLKNDSVVVRNVVMSQSAAYTLDISDENSVGIKTVSGLFMLHQTAHTPFALNDDTPTSPDQIVAISSIALLHEEKLKTNEQNINKTDSVSAIHVESGTPQPTEALKPRLDDMIERPER